jgi:hypothetical protein
LPYALQFNLGFEYQLARGTTLAVNYIGVEAGHQFRSRDGNAQLPPAFATRPDPNLNVLRWIESAGHLKGHSMEITLRGRLGSKVTGTAQYVLGKTLTDTGTWAGRRQTAANPETGIRQTASHHQGNGGARKRTGALSSISPAPLHCIDGQTLVFCFRSFPASLSTSPQAGMTTATA